MAEVINLDLVYDLRDTDADGHPLRHGYRRDHLTGTLYYSRRWLRDAPASVGELPGPELELVEDASRIASGEPADSEGARIVRLQAQTVPADGNIGPRRTMLGLVPTPEDRVRHSAAIFTDSLRGAVRCAERLSEVSGVDSVIGENARGAAAALTRLAVRVEREIEHQLSPKEQRRGA